MSDNKFRVVESFLSVQGEGTRVGVPSYFVRFFGCNLNCNGFGMPEGQVSTEVDDIFAAIDINSIKSVKELPLAKTGCDSYVAIDKRFRDLSPELTYEQLKSRIETDCNHNFTYLDLVFTGGEPLLKANQIKLVEWMESDIEFFRRFKCITFETNGTQRLVYKMVDFMSNHPEIKFLLSVSPKLKCSGVDRSKAINKVVIQHYSDISKLLKNTDMYLKFVVSNEQAVEEVEQICNTMYEFTDRERIFLMPCGGTYEEYDKCARSIVDICMKKNYRLTDRCHIRLFKNAWAT